MGVALSISLVYLRLAATLVSYLTEFHIVRTSDQQFQLVARLLCNEVHLESIWRDERFVDVAEDVDR